MSRRVKRYEGEGRARRPVYEDEGPAAAGTGDGLAALGRLSALGIRQTGGDIDLTEQRAAVDRVARRDVDGARDRQVQFGKQAVTDRPALGSAEHLQQSRMKGAKRHVEVVAATRPAPPKEEVPVSEPRADHAETIPVVPVADPPEAPAAPEPEAVEMGAALHALIESARTAQDAHTEMAVTEAAATVARNAWTEAELALDKAIDHVLRAQALDLRPVPVLTRARIEIEVPTSSALQGVIAGLQREDARASVALDGETQSLPEAPVVVGSADTAPAEEEGDWLPTSAPTSSDPLTPYQRRALEATIKHRGDRKAAAKELGTKHYQSIDGALEQAGRKGLLSAELIGLLPARFAKYATVAGG